MAEQYDESESIVTMDWTIADVLQIARDSDPPIDPDVAVERAREWGRFITDTVSGIAGEQLSAVVQVGQP